VSETIVYMSDAYAVMVMQVAELSEYSTGRNRGDRPDDVEVIPVIWLHVSYAPM
jgi:hypothetical protein